MTPQTRLRAALGLLAGNSRRIDSLTDAQADALLLQVLCVLGHNPAYASEAVEVEASEARRVRYSPFTGELLEPY